MNSELILKLIKEDSFEDARKLIEKKYLSNEKLYSYYMGLCCCGEKRYTEAVIHFKKAVELGLTNSLLYYNLGVACLEINEYEYAEKCFLSSISIDKYFVKSYINMAFIYCCRGDVKAAYRIIKSCLSITSDKQVEELEKKLFKAM